jgi:hypothetical protein
VKTKQCSKCGFEKCVTLFHKNCKNLDGLHYHCKACRKEESLKLYGLTLGDYAVLLEEQGYCCKICKSKEPKGQSTDGRFYVDHNHKTGEVRGLLCNDCNTALGLLKDSPELLAKAGLYLLTHGHYGEIIDS